MQTTGLFSSSSPQQANVGGGSSLIGTLGAALVLVFGVVLLTGLSLDRTQTAMVRFLAEKGVALVTALESGVRSGTRSRTGIRLQYLVEELADRPDVRFIAVTMPDGTILAHSNPARVGEVLNTRGGRELGAETIAALRPSETPSWAIIDMEGSRAFVVFKTFHPKIKGEGRQDEPTVGPLPYVFLGLDLAPLEVAQAQNRERAVLLGAGGLTRAYTKGAKDALDAVGISTMSLWTLWDVPCTYPLLERMKLEVAAAGGVVRDAEYGADITLRTAFPAGTAETFQLRLTELSAGSLAMTAAGEEFLPGPREEAN